MTPTFGIDPALLATGQAPPQPFDPIGAALAALQASGASVGPQVPSLYGTGAADTDLEALPPRERIPGPPVQPSAQYAANGQQIHGTQLPPGSVTITGQQSTPSPQQAAQRAYAERVADPSVELAPDDVYGQSQRERMSVEDAGNAQAAANQADYQAEVDRADRIAAVHDQYAQDVARDNQAFQAARAAAEAHADAQTANWLQQYQDLASKEPNPTRWWDNQSSFGKALWGLGLLFSNLHSAINPSAQNVVAQMVQDNIKSDMAEQRARLAKQLEGSRLLGESLNKLSARNLTDLTDDHSMELGRLNALQQAYLARASGPGAADMQAGLAHAQAWFADKTMAIASSKRDTAVQMDMDRIKESNANYRQARELRKDYDLAKLSASVALSKDDKGVDAHKDQIRISPEAGAMVVDKKTGKPVGDPGDEGALYISKEMEPAKVQALVSAASQESQDLLALQHALTDEASFTSLVLGASPEVNAALARLQQSRVAGQGGLGKTTDKDMDVVTKTIMGFGNSGISDRFLTATHREEAIKAVQSMIQTQKTEVDTKLSPYAPKGTRIDWSPRGGTPVVAPLSTDAQIAQLGGTPEARPLPKSPEELRQARERGLDPRLTTSTAAGPEYAPILDNLAMHIKGSSSDHIRKMAEAALNAVHADPHGDPWSPDPKRQGPHGSEFAEKAYIPDLVEPAIQDAEKRERALVKSLKNKTIGNSLTRASDIAKPDRETVKQYAATEYGFTNLTPEDLDHLVDEVNKAIDDTVKHPWWQRWQDNKAGN